MEEVFAKAEAALNNLPGDKWEKLITSMVVEASETGTEVLHVPAADMDKYKNGFLAKLNDALKAAGKQGALTLSADPAKFKGGVELEGKTTDYNCSFANVIRDLRKQEERKVAGLLFGTEVK